MWLAGRGKQADHREGTAEMGSVTVEESGLGVYTVQERRALPVCGPGGYRWRPELGQKVLVIKTGAEGEAACVAGVLDSASTAGLEPGEIRINAGRGGAGIILRNDGSLALVGNIYLNGKLASAME